MTASANPATGPSSAPPVTLALVRHGEAEGAAGCCIGHTDLALAPGGRDAVAALAARWPAPPRARLVASDLARARESAAGLAAAWQVPGAVALDPRLREMDFGAWDGRPWADLERDDGPALGAWMADWSHARTPGGEGYGDVIARVAAWLADAVAAARSDGIADVVAVTHAGAIRALLVHALGLSREAAFRVRLDHARVTALRFAGPAVEAAAELLFANAPGPA